MQLHVKTTQIANFILYIVSKHISCSVRNVGVTKTAPFKRAFNLSFSPKIVDFKMRNQLLGQIIAILKKL